MSLVCHGESRDRAQGGTGVFSFSACAGAWPGVAAAAVAAGPSFFAFLFFDELLVAAAATNLCARHVAAKGAR